MEKILLYSSGIIVEEKPTGGELRFLELAAYLADKEYAELCCADAERKLQACGLHADLRMKGTHGTLSFLPEEARIILANRSNLKAIAKQHYDGVVVFDVPPAVGLALSGVKNLVLMVRKDLIGYERVKSADDVIGKQFRIVYQWLCESLCLRKTRLIVCQCAYDRDELLRRHPLLSKKLLPRCAIQINNVNPGWIVRRAEEATEEPHDSEKFRVGFIGGFDDLRKGQCLFLKAAELLSSKYSDIEFVLVGGGKRLESYRQQYETPQIRFYGRQENPLSLLKSCQLLAVPSLADSCPNTVMEALYLGVPVVGSKAGGIPDILEENALFLPEWNRLADKIEQCYLDRNFLKSLSVQQRRRKEQLSFDWAETIIRLITERIKQE